MLFFNLSGSFLSFGVAPAPLYPEIPKKFTSPSIILFMGASINCIAVA